jgi:high-affinity iron transporter
MSSGAQSGGASPAQLVVHLLDYVSVDYPAFVKDGKVVDPAEYREQQEFAAQVLALLGQLPEARERAELLNEAAHLRTRIDAKAPGEEVARLATALRWRMIGAYDIAVVPKRTPDLQRAAALYAAQCAGCHGAGGRGDGAAAKALDPAPANFHDAGRRAQRSVYGYYNAITLGVKGTAMQAFSALSDDDRWALAFHVAALGTDAAQLERGAKLVDRGAAKAGIANLRSVATLSEKEIDDRYGADAAAAFAWLRANPQAIGTAHGSPIEYSRKRLAESVAAYRSGQRDEAQRLALSAYLEGFELAEAALDAVDRNLRQEIEGEMIAYRDLLRRGAATGEIEAHAERIGRLLDATAGKISGEALTPAAAALSAFVILLREGLEALLVVAAIAAFLVKAGRREALRWIHAGWIGALVLGLTTWFVAAKLIAISGATRELTEGVTALIAAAVLVYVGFWLHDKSHARAWRSFIEQHLTHALERGTLWALAGLSFLAVYREAFETVLFYQALWQHAGEAAHAAVTLGFLAGVAALALIGWAILRYGVRLPIGPFFTLCAALMAVLAVVFTGQGIKALQEADVVAASPVSGFSVSLLGVYPTLQTLLAQALVLLIVIAIFAWPRAMNKSP